MKKISVFLMFMVGLGFGVIAPAHACLFIVSHIHTDGGSCGGTGTPIPISTTINLDTVFTGSTPDGAPAWLTATFTSDKGLTTGTLTLTSNLSGPDFVQGLHSKNAAIGWAFLPQPIAHLAHLHFRHLRGQQRTFWRQLQRRLRARHVQPGLRLVLRQPVRGGRLRCI